MQKITLSLCTLLSACLIFMVHVAVGQSKADSIIQSFSSLEDTTKIITLMDESMAYLYDQPAISIELLEESERLCIQIGDSMRWAGSMTLHAFAFPDSQSAKSLEYYESALPLLKKHNHHFQLQAFANAADIRAMMGDYETAIEYQQTAVEYAMEHSSSFQQAAIVSNLGYFYDRLKQFEKAEAVHRDAMRIARTAKDTFMTGLTTLRMGQTKEADGNGNLDSALLYYYQSLKAFESIGDSNEMGQVLGAMSNTHILRGQFDDAEACVDRAILISDRDARQFDYAMFMLSKGKVYFHQDRHDAAIAQLKIALEWARLVGESNFEIDALEMLHATYTAKGDYKTANAYLVRATRMNDSIFSAETAKEISNLEVRYETAVKEREISQLHADNAAAELQLAEKQNMITGMASAVGLLVLLSAMIFYYVRSKQRAVLAQKEIAHNEQMISATVNSQEEERQRVAKELHDGIAQTLAGLKMHLHATFQNSTSINDSERKEFESSMQTLDAACSEVRTISHQMMPYALTQSGLVTALNELLEKSLKHTAISYEFIHRNVKDKQLNQRTEIALYRISQELINNIIKHSGATEVRVHLEAFDDHVFLSISDNGTGISPTAQQDGIGMMNIASRANAVNGKVSFEDNPESGTVAQVRIPLVQVV